ncbi:hypothetical protein [Methylobacterium sp. ID0610]|uniref:hypothetical protein n=1 Tax=Methylobacterium carpenticola TaxID=3344827 RepID=UPI0036C40752
MTRHSRKTIGPLEAGSVGNLLLLALPAAGEIATVILAPEHEAQLWRLLDERRGGAASLATRDPRPRPCRGMSAVLARGERRLSADGDLLIEREA